MTIRISQIYCQDAGRYCSDNGDDTVDTATKNKPLLVGVCLEEQFLEEVPHGVDLGDANKDSDGNTYIGS